MTIDPAPVRALKTSLVENDELAELTAGLGADVGMVETLSAGAHPAQVCLSAVLAFVALCIGGCGGENAYGPDLVPSWAKCSRAQVEEARRLGLPVAFENDLGMRFVLIPAGSFLMGSPPTEQGRDELELQHQVTLTRPYYVGTTEVTNRQFRAFRPLHDSRDTWGRTLNGDEQPAVGVSWNEATAFAAWLSRRDPGRSYRLPTEAEWERACRAGTTTAFWWGDEPSKEMANYYDGDFVSGRPSAPDFRVTLPVGTLPANPWGLYEVHGNAREWCSDWYDDSPYEEGDATDPQGPPPSGSYCTRGGAFGEAPYMLRAAWRIGVQGADEARSYVGLRLVSPVTGQGGVQGGVR